MKPGERQEMVRIALSLTVVCAVGALLLGGVYVGTARWSAAAARAAETRNLNEMLSLAPGDRVLEIDQAYDPAARQVFYDARPYGGGEGGRRLVFGLDGTLVSNEAASANALAGDEKGLRPLGRLFVGYRGGAPIGFALEGTTQGYKNRVRFLVTLDDSFAVTGVRVVEHEEDPGLGAEIAGPAFRGQFIGRRAADLATLDVTRDPMPEDWRDALLTLDRVPRAAWLDRERGLIERERTHPIYAVTGATISSRALTDGVRATVAHFRHRWALLAPHLGGGA